MYNDEIKVANKIISDDALAKIFDRMYEEIIENKEICKRETLKNKNLNREERHFTTKDFEGIFKQFYKNGMKDYVVEIETPGALREKVNADGSKYTQDQIMDEVFEAARKSAEYLKKSKFVKK